MHDLARLGRSFSFGHHLVYPIITIILIIPIISSVWAAYVGTSIWTCLDDHRRHEKLCLFRNWHDLSDRPSIQILQVIAVAARPSSSVGGGGGAAAPKFHRTTLVTLSQQTLLQNSSSLRFQRRK